MAKLIAKANELDKSILLELLEASGLPAAQGVYGPGSAYNGPDVDPRPGVPDFVFSSMPKANQSTLGNYVTDPFEKNAQGIRQQEITNFQNNKYIPGSSYDADGGNALRRGDTSPSDKNNLDYFRGGPESWDTRADSTGKPNRYYPRIDGKDNIYGPDFDITSVKDMFGNLKAQLGFSFAGRIKHEVGAGKIASTLLTKGVLYAMNPLPGMIINPLMPWIAPLSHGVGPNLNTVDGIAGMLPFVTDAEYEDYTSVSRDPNSLGAILGPFGPLGAAAKLTGRDPSKGNLIWQSPATRPLNALSVLFNIRKGSAEPGTLFGHDDGTKLNKNFTPRRSMAGGIEARVKDFINRFMPVLQKRPVGSYNELWADTDALTMATYDYLGPYGASDQRFALHEGMAPGPFTDGKHRSKHGYKGNKLPDAWKNYSKTYVDGFPTPNQDGSSRAQMDNYAEDTFDDGEDSPWANTLPLIITDLRRGPVGADGEETAADKKIYFRAFVDSLTEKYTPDWNTHNVFARAEPYYQWMRTSRQFDFKLQFAVFSPNELNVMYRKLNFLSQLQYGTYTEDGHPNEPPLCGLLLGDLIKKVDSTTNQTATPTSGDGLTGFLDGLDITYPDAGWEMELGSVVPKSFEIQMSFKVIHEVPVSGETTFYDVGANRGIGKGAMEKVFAGMGSGTGI